VDLPLPKQAEIKQEEKPMVIVESLGVGVGNGVDSDPTIIKDNLIYGLESKVNTKLYEAVDSINQVIEETNTTIAKYFINKQEQLQELYAKLMLDYQKESIGAAKLLDNLIDHSTETIRQLQAHLVVVMKSTVDHTFTNINGILAQAVKNIRTICREIQENLAKSQKEIKLNSNHFGGQQKSMTDIIKDGIDRIEKLASNFKEESILKAGIEKYQEITTTPTPPPPPPTTTTTTPQPPATPLPTTTLSTYAANAQQTGEQIDLAAEIRRDQFMLEEANRKTVSLARRLLAQRNNMQQREDLGDEEMTQPPPQSVQKQHHADAIYKNMAAITKARINPEAYFRKKKSYL
jgi:hypothetical protein